MDNRNKNIDGSTITVIALIVIIIASIIVFTTIAFNILNKQPSVENIEESTSSSEDIEKPSEEDKKIAKRDKERKELVEKLMIAVNDYQTNNSGKTPFEGSVKLATFIRRYIDADYATDGKNVTCDIFKDPKGDCAELVFVSQLKSGASSQKAIDDLGNLGTIYVYSFANCGDEDNMVVTGTGRRQIAAFYELEDGTVYCKDNH